MCFIEYPVWQVFRSYMLQWYYIVQLGRYGSCWQQMEQCAPDKTQDTGEEKIKNLAKKGSLTKGHWVVL